MIQSLSQITAGGILIEVLEFRRPRYLLVVAHDFLGTGLMSSCSLLPLAGLRHGRAGVSVFRRYVRPRALCNRTIDMSAFTSRVGEFDETRSSAFLRFVSPFWLAAKQFHTAWFQALVVGSGPGTAKTFGDTVNGYRYMATWFKLFYEYGIIGSFMFSCFLISCFRKSRCPGLVCWAIIFA